MCSGQLIVDAACMRSAAWRGVVPPVTGHRGQSRERSVVATVLAEQEEEW
jgi:hypothetical protein